MANDFGMLRHELPEHLDNADQANDGKQIDHRLSREEIGDSAQESDGELNHQLHFKAPPTMRRIQ